MKALLCIIKVLVSLAAILAAVVFLPIVPSVSDTVGDPVSHGDARIHADISDSDLKEIMRIVRGGRFNSVYEIVCYSTRSPLLRIVTAQPTTALYSDDYSKVRSAKRMIRVDVGRMCGLLCGAGVTYYLDIIDGRWGIVDIGEWSS